MSHLYPTFSEAEAAYRRERITADFRRAPRRRRRPDHIWREARRWHRPGSPAA